MLGEGEDPMARYMRWAGALLAAALVLPGLGPRARAAGEERVLRVGYPDQPGFTEIDEKGNRSGYTYEYLEEIAQYTGWSYEFVSVPGDINESLGAMYDMLADGELDLLGGTAYSAAMAETVDYVSQNYGTAYTVLNVLEDNTAITSRNLPGYQGLRVAAIAGAKTRQAELEEYARNNGIRYELVPVESEHELIALLESGRADASLDVDVNLATAFGLKTVARFAPRPYYFITTKGNTDIVQRMGTAIASIDEADPYFSATLYERYFGSVQGGQFSLSDDERAYIQRAGTLRVGVQLDKVPFMYRDGATGELRGISIDLFQAISEKTGLRFEWVPAKDQAEMEALVAGGQVDLVAGMTYDYGQARRQGLSMTRPYVSAQYVMLLGPGANEESLAGLRMALSQELYYDGDGGNVAYYENLEQCVEAVQKGEADYTVGDGYSIQYLVNQGQYRHIRLVPQTFDEVHKVCAGLVRPGDEALLTVLNKAILSIPEEELQAIVYQNTVLQRETTLWDLVEADPAGALGLVAVLALLIIAALAGLLLGRMRRIRQDAVELKKHYELYALSNEQFFEYDYQKDRLTVSSMGSRDGLLTFDWGRRHGREDPEQAQARSFFHSEFLSRPDGTADLLCPYPDGSMRWTRVTTRRVCADGGAPAFLVGKLSDVDEEKRELSELEDRAKRDGLTQLYHPAACRELIEARLGEGGAGVLLVIDLDHFKEVNDTHGHFTGDEVLRRMADVLRELFRKGDVAGRLGGDEFMVYMGQVRDRETVEERCAALIRRVRDLGAGAEVTVSIGAALTGGGEDYESLYRRADEALYRAKENGRNGYCIA